MLLIYLAYIAGNGKGRHYYQKKQIYLYSCEEKRLRRGEEGWTGARRRESVGGSLELQAGHRTLALKYTMPSNIHKELV